MDTLRPTDTELEILAVLWRRGSATVREVHDELGQRRGTGYTTTLKLMQLMAGKGLVARDERARSHVYRALLEPAPTQRRILAPLIERVFGGSTRLLVQQALDSRQIDAAELEEIRRLIEAHADARRAGTRS